MWILPYFKNVNPNVLTSIGLFPSIFFLFFLIEKHEILALCMIAASFIDILDGAVARKFHKETAFGGFIDSLFDRISDFLYIVAFSFAHIVAYEISLPLLLFTFLISYMRARGSVGKANMPMDGFMQRTERIVGLALALIGFLVFPYVRIFGLLNIAGLVFLCLIALSFFTCLQRYYFVFKLLNK